MKSSAIATILAAVSLGGVGLLYVKVNDLSTRIDQKRTPVAIRTVRVDDGSADIGRRLAKSHARPDDVGARQDHNLAAVPADKDSFEDRLARLEKQQESRRSNTIRLPGGGSFKMPRFARSVDDLGRQLKLTETQKVRVADAVERGKQRIEEIMKIPGADGTSPYEKRQEQAKKFREALKNRKKDGAMTFFPTFGNYRNETIPGRNSTYGEEIDRVKGETREEVESNLTPDQKKDFQDTRIDPLLGGGGGPGMIMTSFHSRSDGEDGGEGESTEEIVVQVGGIVAEAPQEEKDDK